MQQKDVEKKPDRGYFLRGMIWSSGGNIFAMASGIVIIMVASRLLSQEALGAYFLLLIISEMTSTLGRLGLRITSIKFLSAASFDEKSHMANIILSITLGQMVFVCFLLIGAIPVFKHFWSSEIFASVVWYVIPFVLLTMLNTTMSEIFVGYYKFSVFAAISAGFGIFRSAVGISLLFLGFGISGLFWGTIGSLFLCCIVVWFILPFRPRLTYDKEKTWKVLKFGGGVYGANIFSMATARAAEAILATNVGPALVAVYGNAIRVPGLLLKLFETIRPVVLSYVSSEHIDSKRTIVISVRLLSGLLSVFSAFIMAFSTHIILILFSSKYIESVPISRILTFWISISIVNYFLTITLIGMDRIKQVFALGVIQFVIVIIGHWLLIPRYGAIGAAVSLTIVAAICDFTSIFMVTAGDIKMAINLIVAMCRSAIPLLGFLLVLQLIEPSLVTTLVLLAVLCGILFLLKSITPRDIKMLFLATLQTKKTRPIDTAN